MITKLTLAALAILAITPAAVSALVPGSGPATRLQSIEMATPVTGFSQMQNQVQVQLGSSATAGALAPKAVLIRDDNGHRLSIPLAGGQVSVTARLPAQLAEAETLYISVE